MSTANHLYDLLPAIYRQRDLETPSHPLNQFLQVIAEQVDLVEADIEQLYDNWFIETCEDWVVPYIADLIGYQVVTEAGPLGDITTNQGKARNRILFPRREIANTIRYRRRKGTLSLLELLANDVAGWPARAVEFYPLLGWTQQLNHLNMQRGQTVGLQDEAALAYIDGPFERVAHTVDIRNIDAPRDPGRYNLPHVGVFVWRLQPFSVTQAPAYCLEGVGSHCYTFSVLGNDTPLFTLAEPEPLPTHIAEPLNLPVPISRLAFTQVVPDSTQREQASPDYYGGRRSLAISAEGWTDADEVGLIPGDRIIPADLGGWQYRPPPGYIAVDPERGRIVFPPSQLPKKGVRVNYHYGFSDEVGGGEYAREVNSLLETSHYLVGEDQQYNTITEALYAWQSAQTTSATEESAEPVESEEAEESAESAESNAENTSEDSSPRPNAVIEITDSRVYTERFGTIELQAEQRLQIRAASRTRPVIRLLDYLPDFSDAFTIEGAEGSTITLDGLLIAGRGVRISGHFSQVVLRHCTLVPGWAPEANCEPRCPTEPSLELFSIQGQVQIEHCILGSIQVNQNEVKTEPLDLKLSDSILDATDSQLEAIGAPGCPVAHVSVSIYRSTLIGLVQVHGMPLAENSLFMGTVTVARRQTGCVRFCYVPPGSKTPRRYRCQPDLVEKRVRNNESSSTEQAVLKLVKLAEQRRVRPKFNSLRYGQPTYCQLANLCAEEIKQGADDESEMGVFHDLFQPQRATILQTRLDEFTPAEMRSAIIYAT